MTEVSFIHTSRVPPRGGDELPSAETSLGRYAEESSQDDYLPFLLDDDSSGPDGSPSYSSGRSLMR